MHILAIGAHPDDIEFGCAGTLAKHIENGDKVHLLVFTLGEGDESTEPGIRREEAITSSKILGVNSIDFCDFSVYDVYAVKHDLIHAVEKAIRKARPKRVYSQSPHDTHQVHQVVARCCIIATRYTKEVFLYELPSTTSSFQPTVFVDISDKMEAKLRCLQAHKSQMKKYYMRPNAVKSLAAYRYFQAHLANSKKSTTGYAEAFFLQRMEMYL